MIDGMIARSLMAGSMDVESMNAFILLCSCKLVRRLDATKRQDWPLAYAIETRSIWYWGIS
jgi:hypothetical protein